LDAFFLASLEQEASVLFSGLRCGVEAQLFCFENVFTKFLMLSDGKDEAFLVLTLFCFLSEELSSSQVTLETIQFSTNQERKRVSSDGNIPWKHSYSVLRLCPSTSRCFLVAKMKVFWY
jgi:hypothetical protein